MNVLHRHGFVPKKLFRSRSIKVDFLVAKSSYDASSTNLKGIMSSWRKKFEEFNIPEADISLQLIASHVLDVRDIDKLNHFHGHELNIEQVEEFTRCCECRLARVPIQYILKEWQFREAELKMAPPVFIPRPETEMLIDIIRENAGSVKNGLEIGCGSGAISISLLKEFQELQMKAIDRSKIACLLTSVNAKKNLVEDRIEIFHKKLEENGHISDLKIDSLDLIVSNPPYILSSELRLLQPEIKLYEDLRALDGGVDGLLVIKAIFQYSSTMLAPSKNCFIEIHHQHVPFIEEWLKKNSHLGLMFRGSFKDQFGHDRFVQVEKIK